MPNGNTISHSDQEIITQRLGREPRGLRAIPVRDHQGNPMVIQVASLVEDKPFPTLFWLIDPRLCYEIDHLEAQATISQLQQEVDRSDSLRQALKADHRAHIQLRDRLMTPEERECIQRLGFSKLFEQRGIGGITDHNRIRCFHTYYAAHLVKPNSVGLWLDRYWRDKCVELPHLQEN